MDSFIKLTDLNDKKYDCTMSNKQFDSYLNEIKDKIKIVK